MQQQKSTDETLSLLEILYNTSTGVKNWMPFLSGLNELFEAVGTQLSYTNHNNQQLNFTYLSNLKESGKYIPMLNKSHLLESNSKWHNGNLWVNNSIISMQESYQPELLRNLLELVNSRNTLTRKIGKIEIHIFRRLNDKPWIKNDYELLSLLTTHIQRAVLIHKRLSQMDFERRSVFETLNQISMGLILVDETQRILFANEQARLILKKQDGIFDQDKYLTISHKKLKQIFNNAVFQVIAASQQGISSNGISLFLLRPSGKRDYAVLISPVWGKFMQVWKNIPAKPIAAIFIRDPDALPAMPTLLLKQLYSLTKTESRIVDMLVHGVNIKEQSIQRNVQENTLRQHLKNIYRKTDTHSQSALIHKIMSGPIWQGSHLPVNIKG